MPVYNTANMLEKCLESIQLQTFDDFELILINDGSTDNSLEILYKFKQESNLRIKIINQQNSGAAMARNRGLEEAEGETVLFLDSDDYFVPQFLEKIYQQYSETDADITICRYNIVLPNGKLLNEAEGITTSMLPNKTTFNKDDIPQYIFNFTNNMAWNKLYKTSFLRKNNLKFDNVKVSNDVFFVLSSLYSAEKITTINETLISYNFLNQDSTTKLRRKELNYCAIETFKTLKSFLAETNNSNKDIENSLYNNFLPAILYNINFLRGKPREEYLSKLKEIVTLKSKKDVYRADIYYNFLLIKFLPIKIYVLIYKTKCFIKNIYKKIVKL